MVGPHPDKGTGRNRFPNAGDSPYTPFAGFHATGLTPNTQYDFRVRLCEIADKDHCGERAEIGGLSAMLEANLAGITVSAAGPVTVAEGGSATWTVVLDGEPAVDVVIQATSDNGDVTAQPASLTFTAGNWRRQLDQQRQLAERQTDEIAALRSQ